MDELRRMEILMSAVRAKQDQLRAAIEDRDHARLALATIATSRRLNIDEIRRLAARACACDPWDLRIDLEQRSALQRGGTEC